MANTLSDFPADRFAIRAYCECGHDAALPIATMPQDMTIDALRARLRCQRCGARGVRISIIWIAAGGYARL
jgi:hypothetical protein